MSRLITGRRWKTYECIIKDYETPPTGDVYVFRSLGVDENEHFDMRARVMNAIAADECLHGLTLCINPLNGRDVSWLHLAIQV